MADVSENWNFIRSSFTFCSCSYASFSLSDFFVPDVVVVLRCRK